jgi:cyclic pyranopterin phosphate synthase
MPEENYTFTPPSKLMQADEIETIARLFVDQGVKKIRLTGGEPLVRKDAENILRSLARLPVMLTMTTNGTRLHEFTDVIRETGMHSVNISLDTLHADKFRYITRRDQFELVYNNIGRMIEAGLHVKVNVVVMKDFNDNELNDFVEWTKETPVHVRFIEFMPFSGNRWTANKVYTWKEILKNIEQKYQFTPLKNAVHDTSKKYSVDGHAGTFAVISTMSAPFCSTCNRMRLTADGKMKNCLFSKDETDLLSALRNGEDLMPLISQNILGKAEALGGQFNNQYKKLNAETIRNRSMITIGG